MYCRTPETSATIGDEYAAGSCKSVHCHSSLPSFFDSAATPPCRRPARRSRDRHRPAATRCNPSAALYRQVHSSGSRSTAFFPTLSRHRRRCRRHFRSKSRRRPPWACRGPVAVAVGQHRTDFGVPGLFVRFEIESVDVFLVVLGIHRVEIIADHGGTGVADAGLIEGPQQFRSAFGPGLEQAGFFRDVGAIGAAPGWPIVRRGRLTFRSRVRRAGSAHSATNTLTAKAHQPVAKRSVASFIGDTSRF